ncbi:MAG: Unknown protein [uncultured Aureispira sp.]|uniref:Methyltransferase domain-containing protein n=1 Tax=uncultured Aureispira sp. TaxID=1331704 RepID=A0A6S6S4K2_9BACT|nr:MAG: Unknown protein [uncultured Aureispira sp.]
MTQVNTHVQDAANLVVDSYRAQIKVFGKFEYPYFESLVQKYTIRKVLDVGCGEGTFLKGLASIYQDITFEGIDVNGGLVSLAGDNNSLENLSFSQTHFGEGFSSSGYDMIMARLSVEHMNDIEFFLGEAYKHLVEGGVLFITENYVDSLHNPNHTWQLFRQKEMEVYLKAGAHPRSPLFLPKLIKRAGFVDVESSFRHISPSTVSKTDFYGLVVEYTSLFKVLEPTIWTEEVVREVTDYCASALEQDFPNEDILLISHTLGLKPIK